MKRIIIGTAGHIDHGKTSLIKALTGFEGDSTPEEKKRGITIELSFSSLKEGDTEISFIDVPGHEKLVKTMISGAFGFDYALLVVDAKEGVKEQTREHLLVLDSIKDIGVLAIITKSDTASLELLAQRALEIKEVFSEYKNLRLIDVLPFSVKNIAEQEALKQKLLALSPKNRSQNRVPRLYVDRVFSVAGVGCVVTGTLLGGEINLKEALYIPSTQKSFKARSIQTHGHNVEKAVCGQRTAINLHGVLAKEIKKGDLITKKGYFRGFRDIDVVIYKRGGGKFETKEGSAFFGSLSAPCRISIVSENDEAIIATLKFDRDMFLSYKEPFALRDSVATIGGGMALGVVADPIKKGQKEALLRALLDEDFLTAFSILIEAHKKGFGLICSEQRFGMDYDEAFAIAKKIEGAIADEKERVVYPQSALEALKIELKKSYSKNKKALLSSKSIKQKLAWASELLAQKAFDALKQEGLLTQNGSLYTLAENGGLDLFGELTEIIYQKINDDSLAPDAPYNIYDDMDIDREFGDEILKKLCASKKAIRLAHNHFIGDAALQKAMKKIRELIKKDGFATVATVKEELNVSRKYAVNYLEYLDRFDDIENVEQSRVFRRKS